MNKHTHMYNTIHHSLSQCLIFCVLLQFILFPKLVTFTYSAANRGPTFIRWCLMVTKYNDI